MRCAVFPCLGLGDGLISLILSYNLALEGHRVDTFHPFMAQMNPLFPTTPFLSRGDQPPQSLSHYDTIFIFYEKSDWMETLLKEALTHYRGKTRVLNPIATPFCDYPFWEEGGFDGTKPFGENLVNYCAKKLNIPKPVQSNGITLPDHVTLKKCPKRVVIHPTSSREGKNWTKGKYLRFANQLEKRGFEPVFILTKQEKELWPEIEAPVFENLVELSYFVAESGFMVGNDSGIGHLASCLGVPTLTICRSKMGADFWRPCWAKGEVIIPPKWIPNLKGMRWRDKKWQHFVPVSKVLDRFLDLAKTCVLGDQGAALIGK